MVSGLFIAILNTSALVIDSWNARHFLTVVPAVFGRNKRLKAIKVDELDQLNDLAADGRPVLIDFFQTNCAPCRVMDGIVDELADEYQDGAHVVKINVTHVPQAVEMFKVRSTPTFVVLSSKVRKDGSRSQPSMRWRASGLVKKNALAQILDRNGAVRAEG